MWGRSTKQRKAAVRRRLAQAKAPAFRAVYGSEDPADKEALRRRAAAVARTTSRSMSRVVPSKRKPTR